ncbi:YtxH domain-containing protein [Parafilimonas sp.]|jgi:gas vesicle protein|uniref:YtxH domain-containing protein n=1 Tax=Parafilimonas sp. TaxID=1969739 RepID=UPI003F819659
MTNGQKFLGGIMLGVAAGVAIALFINSDKGKELLADVSDAASDAGDKLKSKYSEYEDQVKDFIKKGKSFLKDMEGKAKDIAG